MTTNQQYIEAARREYASDEIEIDQKPRVARGADAGAFVAAWVWVSDSVCEGD